MGTVHALARPVEVVSSIPDHLLLTDREKECLLMIADGLSNREIAWRLNVTRETVKGRIKIIMRKIPSISRTALVAIATRQGWLPPLQSTHVTGTWSPTLRMQELLMLIAEGISNPQIAWRMGISQETVKSYVETMLHRLHLQSRTVLARVAIQQGWVE